MRRARKTKAIKDDFFYSKAMTIILVLSGVLAKVWSKDSPDYSKIQGLLFTACVLTILGSFALMRIDRTYFGFLPKLSHQADTPLLTKDWSNFLWGINTVLALVGLLIVDLSFFHNGGFRITAVVGIAFAKITWHLIRGK